MKQYKIHHSPLLDVDKIREHYSQKDQVDVRYVCTSATNEFADFSSDIFFRDTPHPEFGNRYFGVFGRIISGEHRLIIQNADAIENLDFDMIHHNGEYWYSQHRYDFKSVGPYIIDGGRTYTRTLFDKTPPKIVRMKLKDGEFKIVHE